MLLQKNLRLDLLGRCAAQENVLAEARSLAEVSGERAMAAKVEGATGNVFSSLGRYEEAREHYERNLAIAREVGDRRSEGYALSGLGAVAHEQDEGGETLDLAGQALSLRQEIGHADGVTDSLIQQGEIHWRAGRSDEARKSLDEAVDLLRDQPCNPERAHALALFACLSDGDPTPAEEALHEAGDGGNTPETRYYLWRATGKHEHLAEAKRLLDYRIEHAPEEYRESMLKNVRLNREIMEAWEEHGEEREGEAE